MVIKVKIGGTYHDVVAVKHKKNGVYSAVIGVFAKISGVYQSVLGSSVVPRLLTVVTENRINNARAIGDPTTANGRNWCRSEWSFTIGTGDVSGIQTLDNGWFHNTGGTGYSTNGNAYTIERRVAEIGGQVSAFTFAGGNSAVVADGANKVASDVLLPAAFGLESFAVGTTMVIRTDYSVASAGQYIPGTAAQTYDRTTINKVRWYNPSVTTASSILSPGLSTFTGTAPYAQTVGARPVVVGYYVSGNPIVLGCSGDSISSGVGDAVSKAHGRGFFQMLACDADGVSNPKSTLNLGIGSDNPANQADSPKYMSYFEYFNEFVEAGGINNLGASGTGSPAIAFNGSHALHVAFREANPTGRIIRTFITPRTNSSNVVVNNYSIGGISKQLNDMYQASFDSGFIDKFVDFPTLRAATIPTDAGYFLWATLADTQEGLHLLEPGARKVSEAIRAIL